MAVALCLALRQGEAWTYPALADATGISASTAHAAVERLRLADLLEPASWRVLRGNLADFLAHGLRHAFAVKAGTETIGVPTASTLPTVRDALRVREAPPLVWPHPGGSTRGGGIAPLHASVPVVALRDAALHELLALADSVRVGRARERAAAIALLRERLGR